MKTTPKKAILVASLLAVVGMFSIQSAAFADQGGVPNSNSAAADDVRKDGEHKKDGKKGKKGNKKKKPGKKK